jgi:molybdopterin-containing oxidoreductase family iron-sulfur binding subunit
MELNALLGNALKTVGYRPPTDAALPDSAALAELVTAMTGGSVQTLIVLGGNPVYDAPADLAFADAMAGVPTTIHLSLHANETSAATTWLLPRAHFLESWSDARSADGTLSVVQPLIEPLYGGKSDVELSALLARGEEQPGYDVVRESWAFPGEADFDKQWHRVLHDGLLADSALPTELPLPNGSGVRGLAAGSKGDELEVVFAASPALGDGRYANNGWLQELPDAITKLTWDNAALVSPAAARERGIANEDLLRVSYSGRELELPAWIVPGLADEQVVLALGYGRTVAGRVGNGVGVDVYALRTSVAPNFDRGVQIERTGAKYLLAQTQDHGSMEGRPLARETTLSRYREHPEVIHEMDHAPEGRSMWTEHEYTDGRQWGMTIDLNACTGCNACVVACQSENNIPIVGKQQVRNGREMHWLRIDRYFAGDESDPEIALQPVPCMMCENAPCEQVCPVAATLHDQQGLNLMVYNRCIGTRYCSNNCPYKVRRFNFFSYTKNLPESLRLQQNPDVTVRSRGVMEKCTYCIQRIRAGEIDAKLEGRDLADGEIRTACQQACPARAIEFGNVRDESSRVVRAKGEPRNYTLLDELYTTPRTSYLAKLRNPNPALAGRSPETPAGHGEEG